MSGFSVKETTIDILEKDHLKLLPECSAGYMRIDVESTDLFFTQNHALHDTLLGEGMIEVYEIYKKKEENEIVGLIKLGKKLNGYPNVIHGGISALLFDNTFGWVFIALSAPHGVTANLSINYRKPIMADTWVILSAKLDKLEGRKLYMSASMTDDKGVLLADSTTLFITPKKTEDVTNNNATTESAPADPTN